MNIRNVARRMSLASPTWICAGLAVVSLAAAENAVAAPVTVTPNAAAGQDTFVYQAMPTFNFDGSGFQRVLVLGKSVAGHELNSLIRFDLAGVTLDAGEKATLNLYVVPTESTGFPGASPTSSLPVTADVAVATNAWSPSTVTFGAVTGGSTLASQAIGGTNQWVSFDITSAVQGWLDNPASNYGLILTQRDAVFGTSWEGLAFNASAATSNVPFLQVTPEPSAIGLLAVGGLVLGRRRRG